MDIQFEPENPDIKFTSAGPDPIAEQDQIDAETRDIARELGVFYRALQETETFSAMQALVLTQQWLAMTGNSFE